MVAKDVVVISKKDGEDMAYRWQSDGESGYTIEEAQMDSHGSQIILTLKEDTDNDKYSQYLETYELKELVRKYSDYIRYPIKMNVETSKIKEETKDSDKPEYETVIEDQTLNSMVPLWKRQKSQITQEEYNQFYKDHFFDYQDPQRVIHFSVEGNVSFTACYTFQATYRKDSITRIIKKVCSYIARACSSWITQKTCCRTACVLSKD